MFNSGQLAQYIEVPLTTVVTWRRLGIGPQPVKIGSEWAYFDDDLERWIAAGGPLDAGIELFPVGWDADQSLATILTHPVNERRFAAGVQTRRQQQDAGPYLADEFVVGKAAKAGMQLAADKLRRGRRALRAGRLGMRHPRGREWIALVTAGHGVDRTPVEA